MLLVSNIFTILRCAKNLSELAMICVHNDLPTIGLVNYIKDMEKRSNDI